MLNPSFDKCLFLFLTITFILMTVVGTLAHEGGHYLAARLMGFDAKINYHMCWLTPGQPPMTWYQHFWVRIGGPLQTMVTGTVAFIFLYRSRKPVEKLSIGQWVLVFLSLLWLRQCANFAVWLGSYIITGKFPATGDETRLSLYLGWPQWSIITVTSFAGALVLAYVVFKFIPKIQRLTFISAGMVGGVSGYLLWLVYFGKVVMP